MQLTLQPSDLDFFASIPAKWRTEADSWVNALRMLFSNQLTKHEVCRSMGCSRATVDRKIAAVKDGGWRGLVPGYSGSKALPAEFIDYWKTLQESYQRKTRPAYRELLRRWRNRDLIPGYAGHPGWPNLPAGWQERNLYNYQPTKLELTALRHGLGRALALHGPKTLSTRVGLWPMSHIIYDDVKLDMEGHIGTSRGLVVPLQIGALELLSGSRFASFTKPQLIKADGTKAKLKEADVRFAFALNLYSYGINGRFGTTIVLEHGTATLRDRVIAICKRYLGEKITFDLSGMTGKMQAIAGMGDGKGGGGNFRHKAALESVHNLMHNELAALPGQTGHDRDEPEFLGVLKRERELILRLAADLPEEVKALLRHRTFEWHTQLLPAIAGITDAINKRTWHELEGWLELGFFRKAYRLLPESQDWISEERLLSLPAAMQSAALAMAKEDKRCFSVEKLSPHEVFSAGLRRPDIIRPPVGMIAEILYEDLAVARECRDCAFTFEDKDVSLSPLIFESRITRPDGGEEELRDRQTYETVLNPFDPSCLWVFDGKRKGVFLGLAKRDERATRGDEEATRRKWTRSKERLNDLLKDTRRRNTHRTQEAADINTHNAGVISKYRRDKAAAKKRADKALDASLSPAPTHTHHEKTDISNLF